MKADTDDDAHENIAAVLALGLTFSWAGGPRYLITPGSECLHGRCGILFSSSPFLTGPPASRPAVTVRTAATLPGMPCHPVPCMGCRALAPCSLAGGASTPKAPGSLR